MDTELAFTPATEIRRMIAAGEISSVELTELFYQRIEELNPQLSGLSRPLPRSGAGRCPRRR